MQKKNGRILVVDDNIQILNSLKILLKSEFEEITTISNPNEIHSRIRSKPFDIILLDMNFKDSGNTGNEGLFWLREILKYDPLAVVILITAYGDIELAVKAIKEGATDFISKPWDTEKLLITLANAVELRQSRQEVKKLKGSQKQLSEDIDKHYQMFSGTSKAMRQILQTIDKVAKTDANILILGENGTGKEILAREIHRKSKRNHELFLGVDLGSLSESIFESEMFGHQKGSFTDAKDDRAGRFETASGGTLFLDEIGNLSLNLQAKLLSVIQNREVTRLGSNKQIPVNIRLITATNKNINKMIAENLFREDLLYRINTIQIVLPPLRERPEDIEGLADYFLQQFIRRYNKTAISLSEEALKVLLQYAWPGNIRELKHTMEKAVILCDSNEIHSRDLSLKSNQNDASGSLTSQTLSEIEKKAISAAMEQSGGNLTKVAKILDISRTTLYAKLLKYGLE